MPYILKKYYPGRNIAFFIGEGFLIFLALVVVHVLFADTPRSLPALAAMTLRSITVTTIFQLCLYYFDLYDLSVIPSFSDAATRITQAFGFGCIALAFVYYFFPSVGIASQIFWLGYLTICLVVALWRFCYSLVLDRKMFTQPVLIVGTGEMAREIADEITNRKDSGYKIAAFVGDDLQQETFYGVKVYQEGSDLIEICNETLAERIVLALADQRGRMPVKALLDCKLEGIPIDPGIGFYESLTGKILVEKINPSWLIFSDGFKKGKSVSVGKRLIDILVSLIGLTMALPIVILSAIIIKCESRGPIFYLQERIGEKNKPYRVIKFRSMTSDAEKNGPVWATQNDCRTTRYGALMRKLRIDEIPQMWNVLKGDMSFVGPRPERPMFVNKLEKIIPYYSLRHTVKPGITGWAQIFYPYGASEEDALRKLEYDLYYIKNLSSTMDMWIIFQTIKTVLFQKGSR